MSSRPLNVAGFHLYKSWLSSAEQRAMVEDIRAVAEAAPFFTPVTPGGRPMRVRMTSAGSYGWYADRKGYRYIDRHPGGQPWPPIPPSVRRVWDNLGGTTRAPDCCLVNYYGDAASMGLHQDKDEVDFDQPVVSISLGDDAVFRIGGETRRAPTRSVILTSGDVLVMGGAARLSYHGVDRIRFGSSTLLEKGGRINLTLRVVT